MDHYGILAPHKQLVETGLHIGEWTFYQGFMELCVDHQWSN